MTKEIKPNLRVFVEGQTEKNYFKELGRNLKINFNIEPPIDMKGKGYKNFLSQVRKKGYLGCTAIFIIIDLDRISTDGEKKNFMELARFCRRQNKIGGIVPPYFIFGTRDDFEYFACCHCEEYNYKDTHAFIINKFGFKSVDEFKADPRIYYFLNSNKKGYKIACEKIKSRQAYIKNDPQLKKKQGDIVIRNKSITINEEVEVIKNSNMYELFNIINGEC